MVALARHLVDGALWQWKSEESRFADGARMFTPPLVHYLIVDAKNDEANSLSSFQGFRVRRLRLLPTIEAIGRLPTSIVDLVGSPAKRVATRAQGLGRFSIAIIDVELLEEVSMPSLAVVVSTIETDDQVRAWRLRSTEPVLHLPTAAPEGQPTLSNAGIEIFQDWLGIVRGRLEQADPWAAREVSETIELIQAPSSFPSDGQVQLPQFKMPKSKWTMPNVVAAASAGWPSTVAAQETEDTLESSYRLLRGLRDAFYDRSNYPPGSTDLLLVSSGISTALPAVAPRSPDPRSRIVQRLYRELRRTGGLRLPERIDALASDAHSKYLLAERRAELDAVLALAGIEAAGQCIPTIPIVGDVGGSLRSLRKLADALREQRPDWRQRVSGLARVLGQELRQTLPPFLDTAWPARPSTVKVLSDAPFEMTATDDRMLSLRHAVVRIPVTPGFLLEQLMEFAGPLFLSPSDFETVLVLRGSPPDDPIHGHIEYFCRRVAESGSRVEVIDVRTAEEMVEALARFSGALAIVDTHGFHPSRGPGRLLFGRDFSSPLEAMQRLKAPPIVFLAACDTHAVDRGQDTVAAAFLMAGARTVVGTLAPVGSLESAVLVAQLLMTIRATVPHFPAPIRWSELFWVVACSAHAAEGTLALRNTHRLPLSGHDVQQANTTALGALLRFEKDWLEQVWSMVAKLSRVDTETIRRLWMSTAYLTDSCLFTQLGHADSVFLASEEWVMTVAPKRPS